MVCQGMIRFLKVYLFLRPFLTICQLLSTFNESFSNDSCSIIDIGDNFSNCDYYINAGCYSALKVCRLTGHFITMLLLITIANLLELSGHPAPLRSPGPSLVTICARLRANCLRACITALEPACRWLTGGS